jgi:hypothetical protein
MGRTTGLVIVCSKTNQPAAEAEWEQWYDDEHLPDLAARAGDALRVSTRFALTAKPQPGMPGLGYTHVTIHELAGDPAAAAAALFAADAELRAADRIHPVHAVADVHTLAAHGPYSAKPEPSVSLRGHILAWVYPNDPRLEAEWDAWYDHEHVPDMMHSGAFAAATRWVRTERRPYGPNHITLYDVAHPSVDTAVQRSAAVMPGIIAAGRKHRAHTGALTLTLVPTGRHGGAGFRGTR